MGIGRLVDSYSGWWQDTGFNELLPRLQEQLHGACETRGNSYTQSSWGARETRRALHGELVWHAGTATRSSRDTRGRAVGGTRDRLEGEQCEEQVRARESVCERESEGE